MTRHLCTLSLDDTKAVAMFASLDYTGADAQFNFFKGTYRLHDEEAPLIQFVLHDQSLPVLPNETAHSFGVPLALSFGEAGTDPECHEPASLGNTRIFADHKVGGIPYYEQFEGDVAKSLYLLENGWIHLLQLSFPSAHDDEITGMWAFGQSVFHVFCKRELSGEFHFKYCWG